MRKMIAFALAAVMVLSFASCNRNESTSETESRDTVSDASRIDDEKSGGVSSSENTTTSQGSSAGSQTSETMDKESPNSSQPSSNTGSNTENSSSSKPVNPGKPDNGDSIVKPTTPDNGGNAGGGDNQTSKPGNGSPSNTTSSKPTEPEKPTTTPPYVHNWIKEPKGMTTDWSLGCGPDENGYTRNREIAEDKNGKKIGLQMCAKCFEYYGRFDDDKWLGRYLKHSDENKGHGGYSSYPLYVVYDAYYCEGCQSYKRGGFSFYGYYDYSKEIPEWIYLTQDQISELNLPMS